MRILIDFDDTLHDTKDRRPGHRMGQPEQGALMAVRRLYQMGDEIIVLTGRRVDQKAQYDTVKAWLDYFGFPYHAITNVKPPDYDLLIDNKAIHYDTWSHVLLLIHRLQNRTAQLEYTDESTSDLRKAPNI